MTDPALYRAHLQTLDRYLADALDRAARKGIKVEQVLFHAGRSTTYHADDQEPPFHPTPHFRRWVPLEGTEHCVVARPGRKPLVVRVAPRDYWYETAPLRPSYWNDEVDLREVADFKDIASAVGSLANTAYVGNSREAAGELGIADALVEPEALLRPLDWYRAYKTEHEVALTREAAERAADGHRVARKAFEAGLSEREIHWAYLQASQMLEREVPFETIVALDEKSATLHYQTKRDRESAPGRVFLLDAGASADGYASDITRTWMADGGEAAFRRLLEGVDEFQRDLVGMVTAGRPFLELHVEAHRRTAALLVAAGVLKGTAEEAFDKGVTRTFLPHGLGHHLGIQVHDVGGRQQGADGGVKPPPKEYPSLRNTRTLEPGHLVTIEPGIYFIPMLLDELRESPAAGMVNWPLAERLVACGGIRIEDDVLCTADGPVDLTRPLLPGPRG
ncbi:MAG: Xaa-Pro dipeptidase [Acidobacteria bacterium]|nr:Xaa-Pro dipeptidase [Acidobacteriota bacterium]